MFMRVIESVCRHERRWWRRVWGCSVKTNENRRRLLGRFVLWSYEYGIPTWRSKVKGPINAHMKNVPCLVTKQILLQTTTMLETVLSTSWTGSYHLNKKWSQNFLLFCNSSLFDYKWLSFYFSCNLLLAHFVYCSYVIIFYAIEHVPLTILQISYLLGLLT